MRLVMLKRGNEIRDIVGRTDEDVTEDVQELIDDGFVILGTVVVV